MARPLYLQRHVTRHGKVSWYVRIKRGKLIRLRAEYGSEEFWDEYRAVMAGAPSARAKPGSNTLQWLYDSYRESAKWTKLSKATKRQRENILGRVMKVAGHQPYKHVQRADIEAGIDAQRDTPSQARNYLDAMKGIFRWALAHTHVETDPTASVENPQRPTNGPGFHPWDEADIYRFQKKWPVGTRQRVWLDLILYTGLRRGDAVRAGKQHIKDGVLSLQTEKTGAWVHIPLPEILMRTLEAGPTADLAFICGKNGKPLTKESFGNLFKQACREAGLPKRSAHGIRKLAATTVADNEGTQHELEALFGWTGGHMASLYTKNANRKKLARSAASKLLAPHRSMLAPEKSDNKDNGLEGANRPLVRSRKVP